MLTWAPHPGADRCVSLNPANRTRTPTPRVLQRALPRRMPERTRGLRSPWPYARGSSLIEAWRCEYNKERPKKGLGGLTPGPLREATSRGKQYSHPRTLKPTATQGGSDRRYEEQLRNELLLHYSRFFPFTINANQVRLGQGMYLARVTPALFALFTDALGIEKAQTPVVPDTTDAHRQYAEGERQRREQFAFLRNPALARDAKERDTYTCVVCHFSPAQSYGAAHRAVSLECHHLTPLAERNDPALKHSTLADVVTVCANCHRLLHSRKEALSLAEARRFLAQRV